MAQFGSGGNGGTVVANIQPVFANPTTFVFLNGNSGATGTASGVSSTTSATNANVGNGGGSSGGSAYGGYGGGAGGAGAYIKVTYSGGQIPAGTLINYILGNAGVAGSGGGIVGNVGGIKITWT